MKPYANSINKSSENKNWQMWCRLCAGNDLKKGIINIFQKIKDKENMTLNEAIYKYFDVNITPEDPLPKVLCSYCFDLVTAVVDLNERIFKVQKLFSTFNSNFGQPFSLQLIPEIHDFWKLRSINIGPKENSEDRKPSVRFRDQIAEESKSKVTKNLRAKTRYEERKMKEPVNFFGNIKKLSENDRDIPQNKRKKNKITTKTNENVFERSAPNNQSVVLEEIENKMETEGYIYTNKFNKGNGNKAPISPEQKNSKPNKNKTKQSDEKESNQAEESLPTLIINMGKDNNNDVLQEKSRAIRKSYRAQDFELDITCKKCGEQYKSFFPYRQHLRTAHSEVWSGGKWTCPECDATVLSGAGLARHVLFHNSYDRENIYQTSQTLGDIKMKIPCKKCNMQFKSFFSYRQHLKAAHNLGKTHDEWTCPFCGRIVFYISSFRYHLMTHIPGRANKHHICTVCEKRFRTKNGLRTHLMSHTPMEERRKLQCAECDKSFSSRTRLNDHIRDKHKKEGKRLREEGGMSFTTANNLKNEMLAHNECKLCKKIFRNASQLKVHKEIHDSQKFTCTLCGLQYNTLNLLNRHLATHSDMRYKCDHCDRSFRYITALKVHMLSHTSAKPYSCNFCDLTNKIHPHAVLKDSNECQQVILN